MKNKKMPLLAIALLAIVGIVGGTIAYFTSMKEFPNVFKTDIYKTEIEEKFNPEDGENWKPGAEVNKDIFVRNTGNVPVAVRVTMTEKWYEIQADGTRGNEVDRTGKIQVNGTDEDVVTKTIVNEGNWIHTDGTNVYYYNKALQKGESVQFLDAVTLNKAVGSSESTCKTTYTYRETAEGELKTTEDKTTIPANAIRESEKESCTSVTENGYSGLEYELTVKVETVQYDAYEEEFGVTKANVNID